MDTMHNLNFCFSLPESLANERIKLNPFVPSKHAKLFVDQATLYPEIFRYLPFGPFEGVDDFIENFYEPRCVRKDAALFAIFDKTIRNTNLNGDDTEAFAGLIGYINSSPANLATEIGLILILPPFQRTHIASNATGLLLEYALNLPSESPSGLGLRRVVWQANPLNTASVRHAERMGFKLEGVFRWQRALPPWKKEVGRIPREGDPRRDWVGRDTTQLALCWDDWEDGGREKVNLVMQRVK